MEKEKKEGRWSESEERDELEEEENTKRSSRGDIDREVA
jgi:hypothetical protein